MFFKKQSTNHSSRFTHESKLYLPLRKHDYGKNCLSYRGATIWNGLKAKIKNSKSCNSFKHSLKSCFFENMKIRQWANNITIHFIIHSCLGLGLNVLVLCINVFNLTGFWRDHFGNKAILSLLGMSAF